MMKTVKEISELTGISIRTLHYYDEIGLFPPSDKSEAGYRLYDDKALETLQQILFFREFDIPLKEIKAIMETPSLDRNQVLQLQKEMLETKRERLDRLIFTISDILKGDNKMDFEVFSKTELEALFEHMLKQLPPAARTAAVQEFGSVEQWQQHYIERLSQEEMQKGYQKLVEWYGDKDQYLQATLAPADPVLIQVSRKRLDSILEKLNNKRACSPDSLEVREIIGEYEFIMKKLCQIPSDTRMKELMLATANSYRNEQVRNKNDELYGVGAAEFFAQAIEAFYHR